MLKGITEKMIVEVQTLQNEQVEVVVGREAMSRYVGRIDENGEIQYDIMITNPAVLDLLDIINNAQGGNAILTGNPLSEAGGELGVEWKDKVVPIGKIEWVPKPVIGASIIQFERTECSSELSGYKLEGFKLLGTINYIDAR